MSALENIAAGLAIAGAHAGGMAYGVNRDLNNVERLNGIIASDVASLSESGTLPYVESPMKLGQRGQHNIFLCYLAGAAIGFVGMAGVSFGLCQLILAMTNIQASVVDKTGGSILFSLIVGMFGVLMPGLFPIGSILWLRESRNRVDDGQREAFTCYFRDRSEVQECVSAGRVTPEAAANVLREHFTPLYDPVAPRFAPQGMIPAMI